ILAEEKIPIAKFRSLATSLLQTYLSNGMLENATDVFLLLAHKPNINYEDLVVLFANILKPVPSNRCSRTFALKLSEAFKALLDKIYRTSTKPIECSAIFHILLHHHLPNEALLLLNLAEKKEISPANSSF